MDNQSSGTIACELEGVLLISMNSFPYFILTSFEAGGPLRSLILFMFFPVLWLLDFFGFQELSLRLMIFVSMAGVKVAVLKAVAKATLSRFFLEDINVSCFNILSGYKGKKYVVTCFPKFMVEPFLREFLDVDYVIGTEVMSFKEWCLGFVAAPGIIINGHHKKLKFLQQAIGVGVQIDVGLELHMVQPDEKAKPLPRGDYPKPLIFHDGRFVARPTPLNLLIMLHWLPLGMILAVTRILTGVLLPYKLGLIVAAATGLRIRAQFSEAQRACGSLYVCSHRTLLDPVIISSVLQRKITAVTYSLSSFSELVSPIPTVRLTRDRVKDGNTMRALLNSGDLVVCPEGTTCREQYLLRFSPLFAEISDEVVPVAISAEGTMFYGTTVRGHKWLDSLFFLMNPTPSYQLMFLHKVSCQGRPSVDVANQVQRLIGLALGFECTNLTRRDKYRILAGNDGVDTRVGCN
ncbi:putative transferase [Dioscorea sansibarensis]